MAITKWSIAAWPVSMGCAERDFRRGFKVTQRESKMDTLLVIIILAALVFGGGWVLLRTWQNWRHWI